MDLPDFRYEAAPVIVAFENGGSRSGMTRIGTIAGALIVGGATILSTVPPLAWAMFGADLTLAILLLADEAGGVPS